MSKYSDKELTTVVETVSLIEYLNILRNKKFEEKTKK
jgi:hypothetical protein